MVAFQRRFNALDFTETVQKETKLISFMLLFFYDSN